MVESGVIHLLSHMLSEVDPAHPKSCGVVKGLMHTLEHMPVKSQILCKQAKLKSTKGSSISLNATPDGSDHEGDQDEDDHNTEDELSEEDEIFAIARNSALNKFDRPHSDAEMEDEMVDIKEDDQEIPDGYSDGECAD